VRRPEDRPFDSILEKAGVRNGKLFQDFRRKNNTIEDINLHKISILLIWPFMIALEMLFNVWFSFSSKGLTMFAHIYNLIGKI
jgi:hypothetical protein